MNLSLAYTLGWSAHLVVQTPLRRFWPRPDAPTTEEARLVAAAKYGDSDAFDALVERYAPQLHAVARRLVGDDLAADAVQDALLAAHKGIRRFRGGSSLSTWLHSILLHHCRRVGKRRKVHEPLAESLEATSQRPEQHAEGVLLREGLERALQTLPEPFRVTLSLREFSELSYEEIAEVLGVSLGTVKSRIARARAQLKDALEREGIGL